LLPLSGVGQAVGVGAGLDDVAAKGEPVDDRGAEPRVGERLGPAGNDSFDAIATDAFSSRSVNPWNSSSAPRRSSSM
jgi:hypothetical protein